MSHTYVLAIARKGIEGEALRNEANFLMMPFDENMKVEKHLAPLSGAGGRYAHKQS